MSKQMILLMHWLSNKTVCEQNFPAAEDIHAVQTFPVSDWEWKQTFLQKSLRKVDHSFQDLIFSFRKDCNT